MLMAVPITILYMVGIGLTYLMERRRERGDKATGVDWQLGLAVLVLIGLVTLLVYPGERPAASYLPSGARSVTVAGGGISGSLPCAPDGLEALDKSAFIACAAYDEGSMLIIDGISEASAKSVCRTPGLDAAGESTCRYAEGLLVAGHPLLVARFADNRDNRRGDSGPLRLGEDIRYSLFLSLEATRKEQRSFLRVFSTDSKLKQIHLDLGFPDPNEAADFISALEQKEELVPVESGPPQRSREDRLADALGILCGAVDELSEELGDKAGPVQKKVEQARALLPPGDTQPDVRPVGLGACTTAYCAFSLLSPMLPDPQTVDQKGRVVHLELKFESEPEELFSTLLALSATRPSL